MQPMSDSAELLMLSSIFADLEDGETRTENIKRRIDLMQKFIKPKPTPAKVVSPQPEKTQKPEPIPEPEEKRFSFYRREDASSDLIEQLKRKWEYK